jgi:hypothetical protein
LNVKRQASSLSEAFACSCQAQDGTQKMSRSFQSKRRPSMMDEPRPLATWYMKLRCGGARASARRAAASAWKRPIVCMTDPP